MCLVAAVKRLFQIQHDKLPATVNNHLTRSLLPKINKCKAKNKRKGHTHIKQSVNLIKRTSHAITRSAWSCLFFILSLSLLVFNPCRLKQIPRPTEKKIENKTAVCRTTRRECVELERLKIVKATYACRCSYSCASRTNSTCGCAT